MSDTKAPPAVIIRIELVDSSPTVWRKVAVPTTLPLLDLHWVIQSVMGWQDAHLHGFVRGKGFWSTAPVWTNYVDDPGRQRDESEATLAAVLPTRRSEATYMYDYGDSWEHRLRIIDDYSKPLAHPVLIDGRGGFTPEDCGGVWSRNAMLQMLRNSLAGQSLAEEDAEFLQLTLGVTDPQEALAYMTEFDAPKMQKYLAQITIDVSEDDAASRSAGNISPDAGPDLALVPIRPDLLTTLIELDGDEETRPFIRPLLDAAELGNISPMTRPECEEVTATIHWFLEHLVDGVALTAADYLPPREVHAALEHIDPSWIGSSGAHEGQVPPVLLFREAVQRMRLVRKANGKLTTTKTARRLLDDPEALAAVVASRLPVERTERDRFVALLVILDLAGQQPLTGTREEPESYGDATERLAGVYRELLGWKGRRMTGGSFREAAERTLAFLRGSGVLSHSSGHLEWAPTPAGKAFLRNILIAE